MFINYNQKLYHIDYGEVLSRGIDEDYYYLENISDKQELRVLKKDIGTVIFINKEDYENRKQELKRIREKISIPEVYQLAKISNKENDKIVLSIAKQFIIKHKNDDGEIDKFIKNLCDIYGQQMKFRMCLHLALSAGNIILVKKYYKEIAFKSDDEEVKKAYKVIEDIYDKYIGKGKFLNQRVTQCLSYLATKINMGLLSHKEADRLFQIFESLRWYADTEISSNMEKFYSTNCSVPGIGRLNSILKIYKSFGDRYRDDEIMRERKKKYDYLKSRGVNYLVHFTNYKNVESIIKHGIRSRKYMYDKGISCLYNDENEKSADYISTSIEFPNYKMRYDMEKKKGICFAIIQISIEIIMHEDIELYVKNASTYGETPTDDIRDLFLEINRSTLIPKNFTTNPQAEIKIKSCIPVEYINQIFTKDHEIELYLQNIMIKNKMSKSLIKVNENIFSYRNDFDLWCRKEEQTWPADYAL